MATFRSTTVTNTSTNISTRPIDVKVINIVNRHNAAIYVKFYDQTVATFQDTPIQVFQVAATSTGRFNDAGKSLFALGTALSVRVTTDVADNGNTAAATLPIIEISY